MELFLNIAWLAISAAAVGLLAPGLCSKKAGRSRAIACIALVCAVCLLFPVVSMTDDLNSSPAMPEATKLKRLLASTQIVVGLLSHAWTDFSLRSVWARLEFEQGQAHTQEALLSFDLNRRPPPFSSLL